MKKNSYHDLLALSEIKMARDMASLGQIRQRQQERSAQRVAIKEQARTEASALPDPSSADLMTYGKWLQWSEHRQMTLDHQDSNDAPKLAAARQALIRSFGETQALQHLQEKADAKAKLQRASLAERSGAPRDD